MFRDPYMRFIVGIVAVTWTMVFSHSFRSLLSRLTCVCPFSSSIKVMRLLPDVDCGTIHE